MVTDEPVPDHVARLLAREDIMARIRHANEHPEEAVTLPPETVERIRNAPDVDWETPD